MSNKVKGTQKTELVIGTAATKLASAVKAIMDASQLPAQLEQQLTDYALKATDLESKISSLQTEYGQKKAEMEFQLDLDFKTSKKQFAEKFLSENGMIAIVIEEDKNLRNSYNELKAKFEEQVRAEVGKAIGIQQSKAESERKLLEAEYKAREASNIAKIEQLTQQVAFLTETSAKWEKQLNDERQASIQRSANSAVNQTITTGNGK